MDEKYRNEVENLNHDDVTIRLDSLKHLMEMINEGKIEKPKLSGAVNNHIHTTYSFSPYSPTKAIWMAYNAGLLTAGIMDHDSISGAEEFMKAGKITGIATTIGVECRVDFSGTPLNGKRINNPDQKSIAYMALHGIPHTKINDIKNFFKPYSQERNKRNRRMVDQINQILKPHGVSIDFEKDVIPISKIREGGSITERHILFALSEKLVEMFGKGEKLLNFLKHKLRLDISAKKEKYLLDAGNEYYKYDLLGALKSDMISQFYIEATAECPDVREVIALSNEVGAISAYAYLGDVVDSVTGDKKSQKFEDEYLERLFEVIKDLGFHAVTYMPSRNTATQLNRLKQLCQRYDFFEISGEDINSPRQSFICKELMKDQFSNLIDATWALIGHEKAATANITAGMFSKDVIHAIPYLKERVEIYMKVGKGIQSI